MDLVSPGVTGRSGRTLTGRELIELSAEADMRSSPPPRPEAVSRLEQDAASMLFQARDLLACTPAVLRRNSCVRVDQIKTRRRFPSHHPTESEHTTDKGSWT